jgi:hypothetical protein
MLLAFGHTVLPDPPYQLPGDGRAAGARFGPAGSACRIVWALGSAAAHSARVSRCPPIAHARRSSRECVVRPARSAPTSVSSLDEQPAVLGGGLAEPNYLP